MAGPTLSDKEDVESFIENVDEVHRLIAGLKEGTISTDYIDSKLEKKQQKQIEASTAAKSPHCPAGRAPTGPNGSTSDAQVSPDQDEDAAAKAEAEAEAEAERKERAMAKVKELMANHERKLRARVRYEEYVKNPDRTEYGTDYTKWDIWCPDDEEDDLINSIGPSNPQFKAMEKDIDERHRQMVERRQLAERARVAGNEAYKARQYSEALRCYQRGIESERTNMPLHANAAMAALKLACYVQAIEHCDKVLHISDFLHNNKRDPLCVKALQRRAEAYRALQQHGKAVADLAAAAAIEPGNAEVAKQLARAQQDEEEARKARAISKAVSKGEAGREGERGLDLGKLGQVERLAGLLGPGPVEAGQKGEQGAQGEQAAGGGARQGQEQQGGAEEGAASTSGRGAAAGAGAGAGRGPSLPQRGGKGKAAPAAAAAAASEAGAAPAAGGDVAAACDQLRELIKGDESCCIYFRECGGLQRLAALISKPPSPAPRLAPLLLLLNEACMNDASLKQLPSLKVLPACVAALGATTPSPSAAPGAGAAAGGSSGAPDNEACGAAAALLCTAVTREEVRTEVSRLLGAGDSLVRLLGLLARAAPVVQGVALALLGNCMVDKPTKAAMAAAWGQAAGSAAAATFEALLAHPNAALAERAVVLLGNMCTDGALRGALVGQGALVAQLLRLAAGQRGAGAGAGKGGKGGRGAGSGGQQAAGGGQELPLQLAAATTVYNLCIDEAGQRAAAADEGRLAALYGLVCGAGGDAALVARAAGVVSRVAKVPAGAAYLRGAGAPAQMVALVARAVDELEAAPPAAPAASAAAAGASGGPASSSSGSGGGREQHLALLDAAVRTLAILTSADDPAPVSQLLGAGGLPAVLRAVALGAAAGEGVLGNACLVVAAVAKRPEHHALLRGGGAVAALVKVAYDGKGNTASKNAAIALARMSHDAEMLQQLRDLHGIEIIYQYVKP